MPTKMDIISSASLMPVGYVMSRCLPLGSMLLDAFALEPGWSLRVAVWHSVPDVASSSSCGCFPFLLNSMLVLWQVTSHWKPGVDEMSAFSYFHFLFESQSTREASTVSSIYTSEW